MWRVTVHTVNGRSHSVLVSGSAQLDVRNKIMSQEWLRIDNKTLVKVLHITEIEFVHNINKGE